MLTLKLTDAEARFIYQMLDQVGVPGLAQKRIVVSIMSKLEKIMPRNEEETEAGKKKK